MGTTEGEANTVAETKPKRRIIKKAEPTVREQTATRAEAKPPKRGPIRLSLHYIALPFRWLGRGLKRVLRVVTPKYFRASWGELRQVTWPSRRDTWRLTVAVIIFSAVFGLLITVVDFVLDKLFRKVLV